MLGMIMRLIALMLELTRSWTIKKRCDSVKRSMQDISKRVRDKLNKIERREKE